MITKTIGLEEKCLTEAKRIYRRHQEKLMAIRKAKKMPGAPGINQVLRMAIEKGLPLVEDELA